MDGVLVVPLERLDALLAGAAARMARENGIRSRLATGATTVEVLGLAGLIEGELGP